MPMALVCKDVKLFEEASPLRRYTTYDHIL